LLFYELALKPYFAVLRGGEGGMAQAWALALQEAAGDMNMRATSTRQSWIDCCMTLRFDDFGRYLDDFGRYLVETQYHAAVDPAVS